MKSDQITVPGWYYRVDDDVYTRVETHRYPVFKSGILRSDRPQDVERYAECLICDGSTYPPDWGNEFIGPLPKPCGVPEGAPTIDAEAYALAKKMIRRSTRPAVFEMHRLAQAVIDLSEQLTASAGRA